MVLPVVVPVIVTVLPRHRVLRKSTLALARALTVIQRAGRLRLQLRLRLRLRLWRKDRVRATGKISETGKTSEGKRKRRREKSVRRGHVLYAYLGHSASHWMAGARQRTTWLFTKRRKVAGERGAIRDYVSPFAAATEEGAVFSFAAQGQSLFRHSHRRRRRRRRRMENGKKNEQEVRMEVQCQSAQVRKSGTSTDQPSQRRTFLLNGIE